jgi:hypothetical protein
MDMAKIYNTARKSGREFAANAWERAKAQVIEIIGAPKVMNLGTGV